MRKLVEADRLLAGGADTAGVARQLGVGDQIYFRGRNQFGGLKAEDAKELKNLPVENARLKRLLAEAELDKDMLREVAEGNSKPGPPTRSRSSSASSLRPQRTACVSAVRAGPIDPTPHPALPDPQDPDAASRAWLRAYAVKHPRWGHRRAYHDARGKG